MDTSSENKRNPLEDLVHDSPNVLHELSKVEFKSEEDCVEIVAELPAATNVDIMLATVKRWREIQKHFNRPLRVYAWSSETIVEKYLMGLVQPIKDICVTILPTYLKERI